MSGATNNSSTVVDIHTHFLPHSWPNFHKKFGDEPGPWPWMRHDISGAMLMSGEEEFRPVNHRCWDIEQRVTDMNTDNIDVQIISNTPILFQYHRPLAETIEVAKHFNDHALEMVESSNGRLVTLGQVPLQNTEAACEEASRAMRSGHVGIQIGNHVGPMDLDAEGLIAFLQHCAEDDIPVLIHPWDMFGRDRMMKYMMAWTVGMPAETHLSIVALILSGAFDRLPKKLKICFAHGGGAFAFLLPRLENAYLHRDIARGNAEMPPSHYTDRFSVDSAVFGVGALNLLVETMGEDRVMLGSDYPFPLGEQRVGKLIRDTHDCGKYDESVRDKLLGGNAIEFFDLKNSSAEF